MSVSFPTEITLSAATIDAIAAQLAAKHPAPKRDYLIIFLPFFGVLLGAVVSGLVTFMATSSIEYEKQLSQLELAAYSDFAKGQAAWILAQNNLDTKPSQQPFVSAKQQIREASFRVALYSPVDLVERLEAFIREQPRDDCTTTANDLAVYQLMRTHALGRKGGDLSKATLAMVLFGCEYKD